LERIYRLRCLAETNGYNLEIIIFTAQSVVTHDPIDGFPIRIACVQQLCGRMVELVVVIDLMRQMSSAISRSVAIDRIDIHCPDSPAL
jgi:hypothetical protein